MKSLRRIELWSALVVFFLLAVLSIIGAFLGHVHAGLMFTSIPLSVFWVFFVLLILAGIFTFPRLLRTPVLVVAHVGFILVVAGAFWGSHTGNRLEAALTGKPKVHDGYMGLDMNVKEGKPNDVVMADDSLKHKAGTLPFSIRLDRFTTDYYPWDLIAQVPTSGGSSRQEKLVWRPGRAVRVPGTGATVTVLRYLPSARPAYSGSGKGVVQVTTSDGAVKELPATVGAKLTLDKPKDTVQVLKVFGTLRVMGMGKGQKMEVVDVPGPPQNPAVKLEVTHEDGSKTTSYAYARMAMHGQDKDNLRFHYNVPSGAEPAPGGMPAMQVRVENGQRSSSGWLIASANTHYTTDGRPFVVADLKDLFTAGDAIGSGLFMVQGDVKGWKSAVSVMKNGQPVLSKTIEVNHPLHYGGYRFYQYKVTSKFDEMSVASDSGVWLIYVGFLCLGGAMFWWMWVQPVLRRARERKEVADGTS